MLQQYNILQFWLSPGLEPTLGGIRFHRCNILADLELLITVDLFLGVALDKKYPSVKKTKKRKKKG